MLASMGSGNALAEETTEALTTLPTLKTSVTRSRTGVHDPSIVYNPNNQYYYIFGSHMGVSKTKDLCNWTSLSYLGQTEDSKLYGVVDENGNVVQASYNDAFVTSQAKKVTVLKDGVATEVDLPNYNAMEWMTMHNNTTVAGYMWAPDVMWNEKMGKWCMYMSLDGDNWASVIVLLTSDNIEGPYVYQAPVVYSGFYTADTKMSYKKTDLELALGDLTTLPARYLAVGNPAPGNNSSWGTYYPNNIDPCVYYDDEGKLWMSYGSWSGGIFTLQLDENTGLRDYTVTYSSDYASKGASFTSDPYFGKKIAGGYYVSGEGSYIRKIGKYYFLFLSYGGLTATGGYEMRVFRSENPDGPFVDGNGVNARYTGYALNYGPNGTDNRGVKIMGSYKWNFMGLGEIAQGHNSVTIGQDGNYYLVYHSRFNSGNEGFENRVHQMFLNEKDWLVAAPFEYHGETVKQEDIESTQIATTKEIAGTYRFIMHNYKQNCNSLEVATPTLVTLTEAGKVSGTVNGKTVSGKWSITEGTSFITIIISGTEYYGVLVEQTEDPTNIKSLCFTAMNPKSGVNIWGAKMRDEYAIAYVYDLNNKKWPVTASASVTSNLNLEMVEGDTLENNVEVTWKSDTPELISDYGRYMKEPEEDVQYVTLTGSLNCGTHSYSKDIRVRSKAATALTGNELVGLKAYYNFEEGLTNQVNSSEKGILGKASGGTSAARTYYKFREGYAMRQYEGSAVSYGRFANSVKSDDGELEGVTVAMWVKRLSTDVANINNDLFAFTNSSQTQYLAFSPNTAITFLNADGHTMEANVKEGVLTDLPVDTWAFLTLSIDKNGFAVYVNGTRKSYTSSNKGLTKSEDFTYQDILDLIQSGNNIYFYTGMGSKRGTAGAYIDDILLYNRSMTIAEAKNLYNAANRVYDFKVLTGDVNGDGVVTVTDIAYLATYLLTGDESGISLARADVNGDGEVTEADITALADVILQGE
jgi:arabinan endo-1,5-alpha-L-arabinosidase